MIAMYIILGIILLIALILSIRAKLNIRLDGGLTVKGGAGPVILTLFPKKERLKDRKRPRLSAFSYKKHQRRLKREAKKEEQKAAKKAAKKLKKKRSQISDEVKKTSKKAEKSLPEKLDGIFELVSFILDEFPRLASYIHTDVREMKINVASGDAAKTAELYGGGCALSSALLELLDCRTKMKKTADGAVAVNADFFGEKTSAVIDISMMISLFSVVRVGWHTLKWFIGQKIREAGSKQKKTNKK